MTRLFVGNLPESATDASLGALFAEYGEVQGSEVIIDRETGRARGFGFVEMEAEDAARASHNLNGREFDGRVLKVKETLEPAERGGERRKRPLRRKH